MDEETAKKTILANPASLQNLICLENSKKKYLQ